MHRGSKTRLSRRVAPLILLATLGSFNPRAACGQEIPGAGRGFRTVSGQVVTEGEVAIASGVTIVIEAHDGKRSADIHPNVQGRFEVPGLYRQTYIMTVTAEGFFPQELFLDLKDGEGAVTLQVVMHRASRTKSSSPLPALTDLSAPKNARKLFQQAVHSLQANHVDEAREKFQTAIAEYPCYARARTGLASIQIAARDLESVAANLREAIRCDPGFPDACALLGKVLNNQKKFAESEEILNQGLRLSPDAWPLYDQLATAHYNLGQYGKAQDEWLRVIALDPAPPAELHAKLAAVYVRGGARDKAYAEMQAYLRADPNGRFASAFKALMSRLETPGAHAATSPQPEAVQPQIPNP
jgi:tetratricopeptide (TPR) repeat protein